MEQNGITPEDIMKDITADETPAEAVTDVVEEPVGNPIEENFAEESYIEEVSDTAENFVAEEVAVEKVESEEPADAFYGAAAAAFQNVNSYGEYNAAPDYVYEPYQQNSGGEGLCVAALVLGIVGICVNPCYIVSILAIVFGFIGQSKNNSKKALAIWGWALGFVGIALHVCADFGLMIITGGAGMVSFCC